MTNQERRLYFTLLIILLLIPLKLLSQEANYQASDSVFDFLDPVYGVDQRLVNGSYYYRPQTGFVIGTPYYIDETWKKGSVTIDSFTYDYLDLKYDIERNMIVLKYTNINGSVSWISMMKQNIDSFVMNGRLFIPFPGTHQYDKEKFCEVAALGEMNYLILKTKILKLSGGGSTDFIYEENIKQFLQINDQLIPFKRRRILYSLYPEHKQEIRIFMRSQGLSLMKNRIYDRVSIVKYCNQLILKQD